jgi:hypothetical protein
LLLKQNLNRLLEEEKEQRYLAKEKFILHKKLMKVLDISKKDTIKTSKNKWQKFIVRSL